MRLSYWKIRPLNQPQAKIARAGTDAVTLFNACSLALSKFESAQRATMAVAMAISSTLDGEATNRTATARPLLGRLPYQGHAREAGGVIDNAPDEQTAIARAI